jgi:hypothetical protein
MSKDTKGKFNELHNDGKHGQNGRIFGDKVRPSSWTELEGPDRNVDGKWIEGFRIKFPDNTEIHLTYLQLFSILNDIDLKYIERYRYILQSKRETWNGTLTEDSELYHVN